MIRKLLIIVLLILYTLAGCGLQSNQPVNATKSNLLISLKSEISPDFPQAFLEVYGKPDGEYSYIVDKIRVYSSEKKDKEIQEILIRDAQTLDQETFGVYLEDVNFDGFKDIQVQCGIPSGPDIPYHFWLWDNASSSFIPNKDLDCLVSPVFDHTSKTILSIVQDDALKNTEFVYGYIDKKLTLVRETERVAEPAKNVWHISLKELKGNEIVTTKYDEPLEQ